MVANLFSSSQKTERLKYFLQIPTMDFKIYVDESKCLYCGGCAGVCPVDAMLLDEVRIVINEACIGCKLCIKFCPVGALSMEGEND